MFVIDPPKLAEQLLRALIEHFRKNDSDFDDEISPLAAARRWRPASPDMKSLAGLGARRHAEARRPVRRRYVDLRAERRFMDADGDADVKVVSLAQKRVVRLDLDRKIEIA
jgi:hypothetical protein